MSSTPSPTPTKNPIPRSAITPLPRDLYTPPPASAARRLVKCSATSSAQTLRTMVKAMKITPEVPRFDAWPACASSSDPSRAMKSTLHHDMETLIETRLGEVVRKFRPEAPPIQLRFAVFRDALALFTSKTHSFAEILGRILHELDAFYEHSLTTFHKLEACQKELVTVDAQYSSIVKDLQLGHRHELQDHREIIEQQEQDMRQARLLTEMVTQKNVDWRNELSNTQKCVIERDRTITLQQRELEYKRAALKELQSRIDALTDENYYLKGICKHNKDLLEEVAQWRKMVEKLTESNTQHEKRQQSQESRDKAKNDVFHSCLRNIKRALGAKESELRIASDKLVSVQSILTKIRNERDMYIVSRTPRPNMGNLSKVSTLMRMGFDPNQRTAAAVEQLEVILTKMSTGLESAEQKIKVYQSLMYFLDEKDISRAQDGSIPPPLLCAISLGNRRDVPKFLKTTQLYIPLRHIARGEYFFTLRDMWTLRVEKPAGHLHDFLDTYFHERHSGTESAYNVYLSSHTHYQTILDAELYLRVLDGDIPEQHVWADLVLCESIRLGVSVLAAKLNAAADKKKNTVKRRVLYDMVQRLLPNKADSDVLRMKFAVQKEIERVYGEGATRDDVPWELIATEDGSDPFLIELLRRQHLQEYELWRLDVEQEIQRRANNRITITGAEVMDSVFSLDSTKTVEDVAKYLHTANIGLEGEDLALLSVNVEQLLECAHAHHWSRGARRQLKKNATNKEGPSPMYAAERVPVTDPAHREATAGMPGDMNAEKMAKQNLAAVKARLQAKSLQIQAGSDRKV